MVFVKTIKMRGVEGMKKAGDMKYHWLEGLLAGIACFFVVWLAMLVEIGAGLINIDVLFVEYVYTSLFSAFFMGAVIGLLFAYAEKFILFERFFLKGVVFLALFEVFCVVTLFFVQSSWNDMMEMYSSVFAFVFDVFLTVILGGYVIGAVYGWVVKKKVIRKLKRPQGILLIVAFSLFMAFFSLLEVGLALSSELQGLTVVVSLLLVVVSFGLYFFKKWGLYGAFVVYLLYFLGACFVVYSGDFYAVPGGVVFFLVLCYLFSRRKLFKG